MNWIQLDSRAWRRMARYIVISLLLVGAQFFIWPRVNTLANEWHQARLQDEQLVKVREKVTEVEQKLDQDTVLFERINTVAPDADKKAQLIERLEALARTHHITIVVQAITEEKGEKIQPVVFTVNATGRPTELLNYIVGLERLSELTTIKSWSLGPVATNNQTPGQPLLYVLSMKIVFYLQVSPS